MPAVLICSEFPLDEHLDQTLLWRGDVTRHSANSSAEARRLVETTAFSLLLVQRDLPQAAELVHNLRRQSSTRGLSMAILAPEEFDPGEVMLLVAGANAILRFPAGPEWDERLRRLMDVPVRREVRLPVRFEIVAFPGAGVETFGAIALNLSVRGMLIEASRELRVGEDLDLHFQLPEEEHAVSGCARVVRMAGRQRFGLEFYGLESDGTERIRAYLDRLSSE